jgi:hypothetical protein
VLDGCGITAHPLRDFKGLSLKFVFECHQ